ncbi:MAG: alpha/beta hydrolase [Alphaproteobacteria bacterium]|nr:alpha/beta hydrolase [Alphaproteobacteria bacterium]
MSPGLRAKRALARRITRSRVLRAWVRPPTNGRGDVLDVQAYLLCRLQALAQADTEPPVDERRARFVEGCWLAASDPMEVDVRDGTVRGGATRIRTYEPPGATAALVFLHGGGWVVGDLDTHDALCRRLACVSNRVVVAVDYPLAPEHPWPEPIHAVVEAWRELHATLATRFERIAIAGDSAGANHATNACRVLREGGPLPEVQVLLYPGVDATNSFPSFAELGEGYQLTRESIRWYLAQYRPDPADPLGSPVFAPDLEGHPPAIIVVAGFDPLRDEGLRYAERLHDAGVDVQVFDCADMIHGFAQMDGLIDAAGDHVDRIARVLR